ncbi:hypothetical protein [Mucilaginibacter paludis]|uniref:Uncharacterized protein n=1 Tax=Mucilaginibacter paludis DSM 18603 TaxID=714943 RepID=H1Y9H1_9SPHI|nr:hypothetical protein [Mucilaginibacter paludis]EHQ29976.1 hypothetical protein Mucpa_5911 [Mucilaginibacter paludis DSM 18603]
MKPILLAAFIFFVPNNLLGQNLTSKGIEADLLQSFKKIAYWAEKRYSNYDEQSDNKLRQANDVFGKKLNEYAKKYPATINEPFLSLCKENLGIETSKDSLFRIYSWDTQTGGTMHFFANVLQYKTGKETNAVLDTARGDGDNRPNYNKIYTLKANGKTYYLAVSLSIGSSRDCGQTIQVFEIANGKLDDKVKLIKTNSGMHSQLNIAYDFGSVIDWKVRPTINFDEATQTILLPLVDGKGAVTHKLISYKFTGKYFEKVR